MKLTEPSNPVRCFVSPNDTEEFRFTPGTKPHYLSLIQHGAVQFSMLLWADDPEHVKQIVRAARDFTASCFERYYRELSDGRVPNQLALTRWDSLLAAFDTGEAVITECPIDQFFKVGWALNDNI